MGLFSFLTLPWEAISLKYGGFQAPVMRVSVNNNLLDLILSAVGLSSATGIRTDRVQVTLNKDSASSASFRILDCYSPEARRFTSNIAVGARISIQLGYGSLYSTVFVGYVETLSYEFNEHPSIQVTAMDGIKLMMEGGKQERHWEDGRFYLQTITQILLRYGDICTFLPTNILPTLKTHGHLVQKSSDYDFIKNVLCKFCGRDLVLVGGDLYLFDALSFGPKVTTLSWGDGLLSFSVAPAYRKVKVRVTGDRMQNVQGESAVTTGSRYKTSMDKEQLIFKDNVPLESASDCRDYAKLLALEAARQAQRAKGECVGLPDLIPGRCIGISGLDPEWNGKKYRLTSVTHQFGGNGYTTSFECEGWE